MIELLSLRIVVISAKALDSLQMACLEYKHIIPAFIDKVSAIRFINSMFMNFKKKSKDRQF